MTINRRNGSFDLICVSNDLIDPTRLLFELQKIDRLNQSLSGCLRPESIAAKITDGLVAKFDCAFARIWLLEPKFSHLRLLASSGLYTRLDGDFATVPMGAYKVGKIAQHCIPFLSNQLADESWVKDRDWAIKHQICGFAGLPLTISGKAIGVLAVFSHQPMQAEVLEALKILCSSVAVTLSNADIYQQKLQHDLISSENRIQEDNPLSEQVSRILGNENLTLVGTERQLPISCTYTVLKIAEELSSKSCNYCRLTYSQDSFYLEAMLDKLPKQEKDFISPKLFYIINHLGGHIKTDNNHTGLLRIEVSFRYEEQPNKCAQLSQREQEVMQLLVSGMRDREIAKTLFISDRTVKFHINNVMHKFKAKTRIQTVYLACSNGCLPEM